MKIETKVVFDSGTPDLTFSILKQRYLVHEDGTEEPIGESTRRAVVPGDIELAQEFAPELVHVFKSLWTSDVIKAYKEKSETITPPQFDTDSGVIGL